MKSNLITTYLHLSNLTIEKTFLEQILCSRSMLWFYNISINNKTDILPILNFSIIKKKKKDKKYFLRTTTIHLRGVFLRAANIIIKSENPLRVLEEDIRRWRFHSVSEESKSLLPFGRPVFSAKL